MYKLSPQQQEAVWDYFFGRLDQSRETLNQCRQIFEKDYPNFSADEFGDLLYEVVKAYPDMEESYVLTGLTLKLAGLPSYVGYLNPMKPQDTGAFWQALQEP
jgi:hypothetical protein